MDFLNFNYNTFSGSSTPVLADELPTLEPIQYEFVPVLGVDRIAPVDENKLYPIAEPLPKSYVNDTPLPQVINNLNTVNNTNNVANNTTNLTTNNTTNNMITNNTTNNMITNNTTNISNTNVTTTNVKNTHVNNTTNVTNTTNNYIRDDEKINISIAQTQNLISSATLNLSAQLKEINTNVTKSTLSITNNQNLLSQKLDSAIDTKNKLLESKIRLEYENQNLGRSNNSYVSIIKQESDNTYIIVAIVGVLFLMR